MEELWMAIVVAAVCLILGASFAWSGAEAKIANECELQQSFVVNGKAYDCKLRSLTRAS